jgi:opacity protein-like surface antigen
MKSAAFCLAVIIACVASNAIAQTESDSQTDPLKDRLGVRVGYSRTSNDLTDNFGGGLNLSLHFIQRIRKPFSVDVTLGAIYLGSTEKDIVVGLDTSMYDQVSMRILMLTAAPMVELPINDRMDFYATAGVGLYAVSLLLDRSFEQYDLTDNHFGLNAGAGVIHRIFTNWYVDLNFHLHKFWTADTSDPGNPDWIFEYSNGDSDPLFWAINTGVILRLF